MLLRPIQADEDTKQAVHAVGLLLQMAGELSGAAGKAVIGWGALSASKWLLSTQDERLKMFSPSELRKTSKGRFLRQDYQHHCEQGGHPVPLGSFLLGTQSPGSAQLLLVDLIVHCWRIWDQIVRWSKDLPIASAAVLDRGSKISGRLNNWGKQDPMYALMVERYPESL